MNCRISNPSSSWTNRPHRWRFVALRGAVVGAVAVAGLLFTGRDAFAADPVVQFVVTVDAGETARVDTPVKLIVDARSTLSAVKGPAYVTLTGPDGKVIPGQFTQPGLMSRETLDPDELESSRELHFVLPELATGASAQFDVKVYSGVLPEDSSRFRWEKQEGKFAELFFDKRPILRYMCEPVDDSSAARHEETFKVYHHLYDPQGTRYLTKGPGGTFTHHRGIFYGFNNVTYGSQQADIWHCNKGESQVHQEYLSQESGPVLGRHRVRIAWNGRDGKPFASEERELTVYAVKTGELVGFASKLTTTLPSVQLDGDPQHAGFHFRAAQDVDAKTSAQTYYVRPDGKDAPGKYRNWPADKTHVNLPWNVMSFVLDDQRYSVLYSDRPENPKESRFSERAYGRFGSYFEYDLTPEKPLVVNYRLTVVPEEMSVEEATREASELTAPPVARVSLPSP